MTGARIGRYFRGINMVRFTHNFSLVNAETARAIVGKKLEHVITVAEKFQHWTDLFNVEISIFSDGSKNITIMNCNSYDTDGEKYRAEKFININSGKAGAVTYSHHDYFSGAGREKTSTRFIYKDWIVPGAKKLEQIIRKTF